MLYVPLLYLFNLNNVNFLTNFTEARILSLNNDTTSLLNYLFENIFHYN